MIGRKQRLHFSDAHMSISGKSRRRDSEEVNLASDGCIQCGNQTAVRKSGACPTLNRYADHLIPPHILVPRRGL